MRASEWVRMRLRPKGRLVAVNGFSANGTSATPANILSILTPDGLHADELQLIRERSVRIFFFIDDQLVLALESPSARWGERHIPCCLQLCIPHIHKTWMRYLDWKFYVKWRVRRMAECNYGNNTFHCFYSSHSLMVVMVVVILLLLLVERTAKNCLSPEHSGNTTHATQTWTQIVRAYTMYEHTHIHRTHVRNERLKTQRRISVPYIDRKMVHS